MLSGRFKESDLVIVKGPPDRIIPLINLFCLIFFALLTLSFKESTLSEYITSAFSTAFFGS